MPQRVFLGDSLTVHVCSGAGPKVENVKNSVIEENLSMV
ncbi:hypothetical protein BRCON_1168 [Candidatus Sumerlaea chitinivorans]|uniref:Uncharacterized protein n=1 Tax=Sumerlaea chitinivorans TaxID=2250252 RepID=A0A2Z4Y677_SUMC1|nr:hypothetical protein BRCON_1168 [Candidatus Sumerlaea chitinivorans]